MGLDEYRVETDKFELENKSIESFSFPCCVCANRHGEDMDEPCRSCDHNLKSENKQW